jgi:DNA-binding transcriptional MerR regulator
MLRYLERAGLVAPPRSRSGYRLYGRADLNRLRSLKALRGRFGIEIGDLAFAARLRREPLLHEAVEGWFAAAETSWVEWEQRKQERLLAA